MGQQRFFRSTIQTSGNLAARKFPPIAANSHAPPHDHQEQVFGDFFNCLGPPSCKNIERRQLTNVSQNDIPEKVRSLMLIEGFLE